MVANPRYFTPVVIELPDVGVNLTHIFIIYHHIIDHQIRILGAKLLFNYVQNIYRYPLTRVFVATDHPNAVVHRWFTEAFLLNHYYK